jgi:hypothetical protein
MKSAKYAKPLVSNPALVRLSRIVFHQNLIELAGESRERVEAGWFNLTPANIAGNRNLGGEDF